MKRIIKLLVLILAMFAMMTACSKNAKVTIEETKAVSNDTAPVLSNKLFKVNVPVKFDGLYYTNVRDEVIEFYDKECKDEGYEAYLFGIYLIEKPDEWAGGPNEKIGEITINEKLYDAILCYPTESQFGFDREMPQKYKTLYDARYEIAAGVSGNNGETISMGAGTKGVDLYKNEINKHLTALKEKWDASKLEDENMSTMYMVAVGENEDAFGKFGYFYKDLDFDGIEELIIGEIADGDWKGIVYDIYTMVDRKPAHVVSGWDRNRYFILDSGLVANEYSGGAGQSGVSVYTVYPNSDKLFYQYGYKYDEYENKDNPWFISYDVKEDNKHWENVSEERVKEMQENINKRMDFSYTPFSTLN